MIRFRMMSGILWIALMIALHVAPAILAPAHAQGSRKDDIVFNTRGVPLAAATVRICAMPAAGQPCSPLALIYSDPALTQAMANPTATDGLGNYSFYAAPGKYMIEISGPGIATKQLPNVILPSDPSSPTFNSLSSTGNINAFSLNLTGNLTVNGNTTVVGNLASGTLNLANQAASPGAASAGTVNLYTKTVDKRLYYQDDTGTEIGPIAGGSGAQTNISNTFTAPQNIDSDFHVKGPNPNYDVTRFGGYLGLNANTTGNMSAGSTSLTLASALDFANGNGILVLGAGPASTLSTPTMVSATSAYVVGTSTRTYAVVAEDYFGGRVPGTTTATTTTAVATPGLQTAPLASCNRASGVVTCTTTANHNFQAGAQMEIQGGSTGDVTFEGVFTITSVTPTTFTYNQYGVVDTSGTVTHGNARVAGRIVVKWNAPATSNTVLRNYIYACTTTCSLPSHAANFSLVGVSIGNDSYFVDAGYPVSAPYINNGDVSPTLQSAPTNRWLSTTIVSGAGTTNITLANSAASSVTGAKVLHDNTPNILAACAAFANNSTNSTGGTIYIPSSPTYSYLFPIASTLNMSSCLGQTELDFGQTTWLTGTIIPRAGSKLKGLASGNVDQPTPFYNMQTNGVLVGTAYPMIYMTSGISHDLSLESLTIIGNQPYQVEVYQDQVISGDGVAAIRYDDIHLSGGAYSTALVTKGGFGFYWTRGGWANTPNDFTAPPSALFTTNCGPGQLDPILPYIFFSDHTYVMGGGMVFDSCGAALVGNGGDANMEFRDLLVEGSYVPIVRVNTGGYYPFSMIDFYRISYADLRAGAATPLIDLTNAVASGVRVIQPSCATGAQAIFEVSSSTTAYSGLETSSGGYGCPYLGVNSGFYRTGINNDIYSAFLLTMTNGSRIALQQIVSPGAPQSALPGGVGSVPAGATTYAFTASDYDGGETLLGPAITANPNGSQQVVVTAPASFPAGASGVNLYRNGFLVNAGCSKPQLTSPGGTLTDTTSFSCGPSQPGSNTTGASSISQNGLTSTKFRIGSEAWTASPRGEQNVFLPGALSSTWTGSSWTLDKGVTLTRVQVQSKTAPAGCSTNAIVRVSDGSTPVNVTVAAGANDSGVLAQNYAPGAVVTVSVQTAAAGCSTTPADANVTIQYRMQ